MALFESIEWTRFPAVAHCNHYLGLSRTASEILALMRSFEV